LIFENEALYNICSQALKLEHPTYNDLNSIVSTAMVGVTCGFRFPGQLNADLRKLTVNLVPLPRMHLLMAGIAPLTARSVESYRNFSVADLTHQMFDVKNLTCYMERYKHGRMPKPKYLAAAALYRGKLASK
jgi:tubulin beta